jgi:hypothetical protein
VGVELINPNPEQECWRVSLRAIEMIRDSEMIWGKLRRWLVRYDLRRLVV